MVRFTRKSVASLTLGEKLKKIRTERRLSFSDVSKSTRIQVRYLEYLEEGNYAKLPADVYVKGFLRSLATFFVVSEKSLIKAYEREKGIQKQIKKEYAPSEMIKPLRFDQFAVTPKVLVVCISVLIVFSGFFYLYKEVDSFISTPRLVVLKPIDGSVIDGNSVHVNGTTEKESVVFINDQPVLVNDRGEFSEDVGMQKGLNTITVRSKNKFNKETTQVVSVSAQYSEAEEVDTSTPTEEMQQQAEIANMQMELLVNPSSTWVSVKADGNLVYSGVLLPQSVQKFEAKENISVTSGKGNETFVKLNGKDLGAISDDSGVVRDIIFTVNGKEKTEKKK